jgi:hypothetical protein
MKLFLNKEGRLGNCLLKYFFGYVLSKKTGAEFYTRFDLNIPFLQNYYLEKNTFDATLYENWIENIYELFLNDKKISKDLDSIANELLALNAENINVAGYYQNIDYYIPYINDIINIFKNNDYYAKLSSNIYTEATGILIRKGDIVSSPHELPDEWYFKMAEKFKDTQIYFSTDTLYHPTCQKLMLNFNAKFIQASPLDTILIFSQFKNLILSQGTFSWWAGILNENNVYSAIPDSGWNSNECDVNLQTPWWNWLKISEIV